MQACLSPALVLVMSQSRPKLGAVLCQDFSILSMPPETRLYVLACTGSLLPVLAERDLPALQWHACEI